MKKDVYNYFIEMQKQYNNMNKLLEKVNKEIQEGHVSNEQRENFETYFNNIKGNYERVAYIVHLLKQPPKFIQYFKNKKLIHDQKVFEKKMKEDKATLEDVVDENKTALENINEELNNVGGDE